MNPTPLLILSGAYVNAEIASEYGRLPPSFLPLGGQRLFERQIALARGPVFLTLPSDFQIDPIDQRKLEDLAVTIIKMPPELGLIDALRDVLTNLTEFAAFDLLHGDTLVEIADMDDGDLIACHDDPGPYFWAYVDERDGVARYEQGFGDGMKTRRVVCGYQRVADTDRFIAAAKSAASYVDLLNIYTQEGSTILHNVSDWYDFGHLSLLYKSKRKVSVARAFNNVSSDENFAIKSSEDLEKMRAESQWYLSIPEDLKIFTPRFFGKHDQKSRAGYRLEYVYQPLVSDLFVFGDLPLNARIRILSSCFDFLDRCRAITPHPDAPELSPRYLSRLDDAVFRKKTKSRIEEYSDGVPSLLDQPIRINGRLMPSLREVADRLIGEVPATEVNDISICHGDFFFGNMFFDYRASRIIVIDPRGSFVNSMPCIWGDRRYDVAKLAHSVIGGYDQIIFGRSKLSVLSNNDWNFELPQVGLQSEVEAYFLDRVQRNYEISDGVLRCMTALLFFSMLPLHKDDPVRQRHLLANGFRLAAQVKNLW